MTQTPLHPWQWPEETWRAKVDHVRAGRSLKPATWPGGARCAVALSFDVDHETNELRDGGNSIGRLSWGQYGNRVGVPRILELLKREDIQATFFVPAVAALLHPDEQRRVIAEGHEIGLHGWIHELNTQVPPGRRARAASARRRHAGDRSPASGRSACARRPGISPRSRWRSSARWACSTTPR